MRFSSLNRLLVVACIGSIGVLAYTAVGMDHKPAAAGVSCPMHAATQPAAQQKLACAKDAGLACCPMRGKCMEAMTKLEAALAAAQQAAQGGDAKAAGVQIAAAQKVLAEMRQAAKGCPCDCGCQDGKACTCASGCKCQKGKDGCGCKEGKPRTCKRACKDQGKTCGGGALRCGGTAPAK